MPGTPTTTQVTSSGALTINTLPSSNPAGTSDTVALPFQGVTGGVPVPAVLGAGAAAIGSVIGRTSNPAVMPVITAAAYSAGQEIGPLMTFAVGGAGSGLLQSIRIRCKSVQTTSLILSVFDVNPTNTTWTDRSTPAINAADVFSQIDEFLLASPNSSLGTHTIWSLDGIGASFIGANLYCILTCVSTPTFASTSDLSIKLGLVDD